jgi:hypothetical protein
MQTLTNKVFHVVGDWIQRVLEVQLPIGTAYGLRTK